MAMWPVCRMESRTLRFQASQRRFCTFCTSSESGLPARRCFSSTAQQHALQLLQRVSVCPCVQLYRFSFECPADTVAARTSPPNPSPPNTSHTRVMGKEKAPKAAKDPNAPKRPLGAYMLFSKVRLPLCSHAHCPLHDCLSDAHTPGHTAGHAQGCAGGEPGRDVRGGWQAPGRQVAGG